MRTTTAALITLSLSIGVYAQRAGATCENEVMGDPHQVQINLDDYANKGLPHSLIAHYVSGDPNNSALVLLPPIGGSSEGWPSSFIRELEKRYYVIRINPRGHGNRGKSTSFAGRNNSPSVLAHDVISVLNHLNIPRAAMYGFSMGARIALRVAGLYPDRTTAVFMEDMHAKRVTHGQRYKEYAGVNEVLASLKDSYTTHREAIVDLELAIKAKAQYIKEFGFVDRYLRGSLNVTPFDGRFRFSSINLYGYQALSEDQTDALVTVEKNKIPLVAFAADERKNAVLSNIGIQHIRDHANSARVMTFPGAFHGIVFNPVDQAKVIKAIGQAIEKSELHQAVNVDKNLDFYDQRPLPLELVEYNLDGDPNKPTVLLIHGLGSSQESWTKHSSAFYEQLLQNYQVLRYSIRGHGATAAVGKNYSLSILAKDAAYLMRRLGIESAHVIGHSLGARIGAQLAADEPTMVSSFISVDMHFKSVRRAKSLETMFHDTDLLGELPASFASYDQLQTLAGQKGLSYQRAEILRDGSGLNYGRDGRVRLPGWHYFEARIGDQMDNTLRSIKAPTVFFAADENLKYEDGQLAAFLRTIGKEHLKTVLPQARIVDFPGAGHGIYIDQPDGFTATVLAHLKANANFYYNAGTIRVPASGGWNMWKDLFQ